VTAAFLRQIEAAVRGGLTVSQIEHKLGINNRAVRKAKAELYRTGVLPTPDYGPRKTYGNHNSR
jgi:hypothetical protein